MPSKQLLAVIVTASFAIGLQFTPLPERWRLPVVSIAWSITVLAGLIWLLEHRRTARLSPIEKRDRLDKWALKGDNLYAQWQNGKKPKWRSKIWLWSTDSFVKRNFGLAQYDTFIEYLSLLGNNETMRQRIRLYMSDKDGRPDQISLDLASQLGALRSLRAQIRD